MHSNGTLPLDTPLDARCVYALNVWVTPARIIQYKTLNWGSVSVSRNSSWQALYKSILQQCVEFTLHNGNFSLPVVHTIQWRQVYQFETAFKHFEKISWKSHRLLALRWEGNVEYITNLCIGCLASSQNIYCVWSCYLICRTLFNIHDSCGNSMGPCANRNYTATFIGVFPLKCMNFHKAILWSIFYFH